MDSVILNSSLRSNTSEDCSNSRFQVPYSLTAGQYRLELFHFPITMYTIDSLNNKLYFYENSTNKTATITSGTYTASALATEIASQMTTISGGHNTYTGSYSTLTSKMTFSASNNFKIMHSSYTTNFCGRQIGFTTDSSAGDTSQTGNAIVNLQRTSYIGVTINNFQQYQSTSYLQGATYIIPVVGEHGSILVYSPAVNHNIQLSGLQNFNVELRDQYGERLVTNGGNFTLVLKKI